MSEVETTEQFKEECFTLLDRADACMKLYQVMCDDPFAPPQDLIADLAHLAQEKHLKGDEIYSGAEVLRMASGYYKEEEAGEGIVGADGPFDYKVRL